MIYQLTFLSLGLSACPFLGATDSVLSKSLLKSVDHGKLKLDANPLTTTPHGCTCTSECGGSLDMDAGTCGWCYTKDGCGHRSLLRLGASYDYCLFPPDNAWDKQTAGEKLIATWKNIIADEQMGSFPFPSTPLNPGAFVESVRTTFDNHWDWLPNGRVKYIHAQGMVCPIDLNVQSTKYTGVFRPSNGRPASGLLRLGSALPVTPITGIVPGVGMKFFRSGVQSANWVMLHDLAPQIGKTYDMFAYTQYNHIGAGPFFTAPLAEKFKQASGCIQSVGLSDVCEYDVDGNKISNAVFPFKIEFRTGDAKMDGSGCGPQELMDRMLKAGKKGVKLYDVYAYESPTSEAEFFGTITVSKTTDCVQSKYGDAKLFYRHQRVEEDWAKRPEWVPNIKDSECGGDSIKGVMRGANENAWTCNTLTAPQNPEAAAAACE